jgi:predicted adenylyl cyclase CyaB
MKEIEVKIIDVNRSELEKALEVLGAQKTFDGDIQTIFFDFESGTITKHGNLLRIRKNPKKTELTYKKVKHTQTAKIAEEYSVEVSNLEAMIQILQNLSLTITGNMEKHRVSYKLDNAEFDIDHYTGTYAFIPEFLEIEAENTSQIYKYAEILGFKPKDCLPWSTEELIRHYKEKNEN